MTENHCKAVGTAAAAAAAAAVVVVVVAVVIVAAVVERNAVGMIVRSGTYGLHVQLRLTSVR